MNGDSSAQTDRSHIYSGHWQPALRPDDDLVQETPSQSWNEPFVESGNLGDAANAEAASGDRSEDISLPAIRESRTAASEDTYMQNSVVSTAVEVHNLLPVETKPPKELQRHHSFVYDEDELEDDGDAERLDPAWGIQRMNTDQILGSVKRTSSFPAYTAVMPTSEDHAEPTQPVVQALGDDTETKTTSMSEFAGVARDPAQRTSGQAFQWNNDEEGEVEDVLAHEERDPSEVHNHNAEESRYEEGVPLIQNHNSELPEAPKMANDIPLETEPDFGAEDTDDADFFTQRQEPERFASGEELRSPELTRKSTSAVLESLNFESKPGRDDDADEDQDFSSRQQITEPVELITNTQADVVDDPWKTMAEDDEFLVEDPDDLLPDSEPSSPSSFIAALKEDEISPRQPSPPKGTQRPYPPRKSSAHYAPHQPTTAELSQLSPSHETMGFASSFGSFQSQLQQQQRPEAPRAASSFADQAKGGYKSPYDLPMELSKPKKRPAVLQQPSNTNKAIPPPPRSSSISDKPMQSPFTPSFQTGPQPSPRFPPSRDATASIPTSTAPPSDRRQSSFFEELPMTSKPRQMSSAGRYTPQPNTPSIAPPPMAPPSRPMQSPPQIPPHPQATAAQQPLPQPADPYAQFQLQPPERLDPFSSQPLQASTQGMITPAPAVPSTRYSPAPPAALTAPRTGPSPRYSPAPPSQAAAPPALNRYASQPTVPPVNPPPPQLNRYASQNHSAPSPPAGSLPFQPRTSSPLVHQKSIDQTAAAQLPTQSRRPSQYAPNHVTSPPIPSQPTYFGAPSVPEQMVPPQRSQTQSPGKQRPQATPPAAQRQSAYRPASAHGTTAPMRAFSQMEPSRMQAQSRVIPEQIDFIQPNDESRTDPLQRWKGAPVFRFGFGGTVISSFPKHVPRYAAGAVRPQMKPTVGDVSIREVKAVLSPSQHVLSFPGPLRVKSKKKELLIWLTNFITHLEAESSNMLPSHILPDSRKRSEERTILWKIVKSMVEHDGALDSGEALKAVNVVLAPEIHAIDDKTATQYREDISPSAYRPSGTHARPDSVDPMTIDALRKHLLKGNRKEAVWHAVDNRLWSHAFLIASTMPRDTWKQVVQEFVKQEVKTAGDNTESLSTLYEVFGGNAEDCVDQLVPPSARAGLQMVRTVDTAGPTKNALDALDKWRETLTLIINNRSHGDHQALSSLGRLLAEYGRTEAAHICFLFSRSASNPTVVAGLDDPAASIVLLGADHRKQPSGFARDLDAILLTEVYEFATLILTGSATPFMPYLSPYKLRHAALLADEGARTEAQAYCDSLTATLRNAKVSSYYAPAFLGELEDFSNRLKQVPIQASGSWMGKPNLEKVSGSLLSKLSNFVAGDDSDADSKGSTREPTESGPFAHVAGTPSLSRAASQSELVGYPTSAPQPLANTIAGSRYAPNGLSSARSSSELTRGRPSLDSQRSPPSTSYANGRPSPYDPINMMQQGVATPPANPYGSFASPGSNQYQATPPQSTYAPTSLSSYSPRKQDTVQESYVPTPPPEQPMTSYEPVPQMAESYEPQPVQAYDPQPQLSQPYDSNDTPALGPPISLDEPSFRGYAPSDPINSIMPPQEEPATADIGYAAPTDSYGYAPPEDGGYVPYAPEPDSPEQSKPKKRFGDEDEDDFSASATPAAPVQDDSAARRAANDAAADAAFRAAAEADAQVTKEKSVKPKSSGWFGGVGGWLGGGKKSDSLDATPAKGGKEPAVYRAKLGESKMKLYYDNDLKRWINPDNPDAGKSAPTPPPPRASSGTPSSLGISGMAPPPPRSVSAAPPTSSPSFGPPGSGPPSRVATPTSGGAPPLAAPLPPGVAGALGGFASSGPPSRPGTAMSNASSIDDLLGAGPPMGGAKRGAKGKGAKKGRYVDVMAK